MYPNVLKEKNQVPSFFRHLWWHIKVLVELEKIITLLWERSS